MKVFFAIVMAVLAAGMCRPASAQVNDRPLSSERPPVIVSMQGVYERIEIDGLGVREMSLPFYFFAPFSRYVSMDLQTGGAAARSDDTPSLSGFRDARLNMRYSRRFVTSSLSMSLGVNLPSGKKELSLEELGTAIYLSQPFFGFQSPGFGQGFNLTPSMAWAFSASEHIVIGIVAEYGFKNAFFPVEDMEDQYDPGDELTAGLGIDVRLSSRATISGDASLGMYGRDKVGTEAVFEAGKKWAYNAMFRWVDAFDELRIYARYVGRERGSVFDGSTDVLRVQTLPTRHELTVYYRWRAARHIFIALSTGAQQFGASTLYGRQRLGVFRVAPEFSLGERIDLHAGGAYMVGSFSGFDVGGGMRVKI